MLHCGRVGKGKRGKAATGTDLNMPNNKCLVRWACRIIALLEVELRRQQRQTTRECTVSCDRVVSISEIGGVTRVSGSGSMALGLRASHAMFVRLTALFVIPKMALSSTSSCTVDV